MRKIILIMTILVITTFFIFNVGYANSITDYFKNATAPNLDPGGLKSTIFSILSTIGYGLAACVTLVTGIQFLTAGPQKKSQLKEKLWLIALAVLILAAGVPIFRIIELIFYDFRTTLISTL